MRTVLLRLTGFAVFPLLSLVTPFLLTPVVALIVGGQGISSVVSGQAIGSFAATVVIWGWNVDGPVAAARAADDKERAEVYSRSMRTRLLLALIAMPVACLVAYLVAIPGFGADALAMAVSTAIAGLSPAWFGIGLGKPEVLALYDTVPRVAGTLAAVPVLLLTHQVWPYPVLLVVATAVGLAVFQIRFAPRTRWFPDDLREPVKDIVEQRHTAAISIYGTAYAATPAPIATAMTSPVAAGSLSAADTIYRFGLFSVAVVGNAFQNWAIKPGNISSLRRHSAAVWAHVGLGLAGWVILVVAGPWASHLLFAGQAQATVEVCFYYGIAFFFVSVSTPLIRNILVPAGEQRLILRWTIAAAVLGVAAMVFAAWFQDAAKVALGMALSEALLCVGLVLPALRELRRLGEAS